MRLHAEGRLRLLARPAPDIGEADEADGCREDALLPRRERRERERGGRVVDSLLLRAAEPEDLCRGKGSLGARCLVGRQQLEIVVGGRVIGAQAEQAGDRLGAEARGRREPGGANLVREERRGIGEFKGGRAVRRAASP